MPQLHKNKDKFKNVNILKLLLLLFNYYYLQPSKQLTHIIFLYFVLLMPI